MASIRRFNSFPAAEVNEFGEGEGLEVVEFILVGVLYGGWGFDAEGFAFIVVNADDGGDEVAEFGAGEVRQGRAQGVVYGVFGRHEFSEGEPQHGQVDVLMVPSFSNDSRQFGVIIEGGGLAGARVELARRGGGAWRGRVKLTLLRDEGLVGLGLGRGVGPGLGVGVGVGGEREVQVLAELVVRDFVG